MPTTTDKLRIADSLLHKALVKVDRLEAERAELLAVCQDALTSCMANGWGRANGLQDRLAAVIAKATSQP